MATKYRKKPVVIEAFEFHEDMGTHTAAIPMWFMEACGNRTVFEKDGHTCIKTLEGDHIISDGDFVIQGIKGEIYPCKPDIFAATYEPVEFIKKRPTIDELEALLKREDLKVVVNPDGSISAVQKPFTSLDCVASDSCKVSTPVLKP